MMKSSKAGLALFGTAIAVSIYWVIAGASIWTMTKIPVEVKDELFGTTSTEWHSGFRPGLELMVPIVLLLIGLGIWLMRRQKRLAN